jgi:hypothetical protein
LSFQYYSRNIWAIDRYGVLLILLNKFMKNVLISVLLVLGLLFNTGTMLANTTSPSVGSKFKLKIEQREQKLLDIKNRDRQVFLEKKASQEAKINNLKQGIVRTFYNQMASRLNATIDRLNILITRIESRIAKIESSGTTVNQSVKDDLNKAKQLLADSQALLTSSNNALETVLTSNQPKEAFKILKENILDIKTNLVEVHSLLVKIIGDIKGLRVGQTKISPTVTITPTP